VGQIALGYVLNQPFNAFAIVGSHRVDQLAELVRGAAVRLDLDELRWLEVGA
jgi:aryl-alcohol dehydrogenase-like predicted oxidoreductase